MHNFIAYVASPSANDPPPGITATSQSIPVTWVQP